MLAFCFLAVIAHAEPLDERMDTHWRLASALQAEVIRGNLDVVRDIAIRLAALPPDGFGVELDAPLERLQGEATHLAISANLVEATVGVSRVAGACGACHTQLADGPSAQLKSWRPVGAEEEAPMAEHQEAMDWMWLGIVVPSERAWRRGLRSLRRTAPDDAVLTSADRADQATPEAFPAAYADLLQACARCHVSVP